MATNSNQKLHGKNGAIKVAVTGAAPVKVASKTEWTLNLARDYVDATVFGDTNKTYLVGLKDIQGTYSGLLDTSGDMMVNATASDALYIYLYADDTTNNTTGAAIMVAYGPGLIDANMTASNTDAIRVTGNFRAAGAWTVFTSGTLS